MRTSKSSPILIVIIFTIVLLITALPAYLAIAPAAAGPENDSLEELKEKVNSLELRLIAIENAIATDPAEAVGTVVLNGKVDAMHTEIEFLRSSVDQLSNLRITLLGIFVTVVLGFLGNGLVVFFSLQAQRNSTETE